MPSWQRWAILAGASIMLSLAMGMRQSFGLFQTHMVRDTGVTMADFALAIAVQNIVWGLTQPFVGALSDRYGTRWVTLAGVAVYAAGLVLMVVGRSPLLLILGMGICVGFALSCTASSITMSITSRTVNAAHRSLAMGAVSAIGSVGLTILSPLAQTLISTSGWQVALMGFLGVAVVMVPAALFAGHADRIDVPASPGMEQSLGGVLRQAMGHSGFVVMALAFFVCGLQLVFLTTHLPTYLATCGMDPTLSATALALIGLFNVAGSYLFGWLGDRHPRQWLLGGTYIVRSLAIAAYFMLPASTLSTVIFAAVMGTLWLGVVPLVNGLVVQLFGLRFQATLVGIAFLSHQVGSFLGAWGGGMIYQALGSYDRAWQASVLIGIIAGVFQMAMNVRPPSREPALPVAAAAAA